MAQRTDIIEWINEGLKLPGKSKGGLADALGRAPSAISQILKGDRAVKASEIPLIRDYFGTAPPDELSPKLIRPSGPEPSEVVQVGEGWPDVGHEWMDVRGVAVGGDDTGFYFGDVIDQVRRPPGIRNAKNVAALNAMGESMVPRFRPGELVYIQLREPTPGDDVVVELYPEDEGDAPKAFLKELVRTTGRRIFCKQHNPKREIEFDRGEVNRLWRVLTLRDLLG